MPLRRGRRRRRPTAPGSLKLTSMMDILTVLLLFLLKSFVVEGEVITPAPGVSLPESTSDTSPESSVVVAILDDRIMLDGRQVAQVASAVADANAAGGGESPQWLYTVRFDAAELWGRDTSASSVCVDCWEPYLE